MADVKIERNGTKGVHGVYRGGTPSPASQPANPVSGSNQVDQVTLSEKASRASEVKSQLTELPDVRTELIQQLKAQIEEGSYKVEARKLAAKLRKARVLEE